MASRVERYIWISGTPDPDVPQTYNGDYQRLSYKVDQYMKQGYHVIDSGYCGEVYGVVRMWASLAKVENTP